MKRFLVLAVCSLAAAFSVNAQDIINKKDSTTIEAKIISIKDDVIDYKRSNYLDGPTFSISVYDVISIVYANGEKQEFVDAEAKAVTDKGIVLGMAYRDYKALYNSRDYVHIPGEPYSPVWAGIGSFFIPGLGQMTNEQFLKGIAMLVGSTGLLIGGFCAGKTIRQSGKTTVIKVTAGSIACWCGSLAIDIFSICDAVHVAKIKNLYWKDCQHLISNTCDIKLVPDLAFTPTAQGLTPTVGMALTVRF